jgi:hypothetical protein
VKRRVGITFWLESVLAAATAIAGVLTLAWGGWIEAAFNFDPDGQSGSLELGLTIALFLSTLICAALARRERRRAVPA